LLSRGAQMKPITLFVVLLVLAGGAAAQLATDKDKGFVVELHPGEITSPRTLTLENVGDMPISEITITPIGGEVMNLVTLGELEEEELAPGDDMDLDIIFSVPSDVDPGIYKGFVYFLDDVYPTFPLVVEFEVEVIEQENYGVSLNIEDARSASMQVEMDEPAEFELMVRNTGLFRDIISIDSSPAPEDWSVTLFNDKEAVDLPYSLPLSAGAIHILTLKIAGDDPGHGHEFEITATSLSDRSKNATVEASVDIDLEVRPYIVKPDIPSLVVVNRTYTGTIKLGLGVVEVITVTSIAPPDLMVIPETQLVRVGETKVGTGKFTLMAARSGIYPLKFRLVDSSGIPLPEEEVIIIAVETDNFAIVTGDDLFHKSVVFTYTEGLDGKIPPVFVLPSGELGDEELEEIEEMPISRAILLGNESAVSSDAEARLAESISVERITGEDLCETTWLFASAMWPSGTEDVMLTGAETADVFRAYQEAKKLHVPLVICGSGLSETSRSIIEDLMKRDTRLSKVLISGKGVDKTTVQALEDMGLSTEEVT